MRGNTLTPHRRAVLYDRILDEEEVDWVHQVVHALAGTPDGPLEVRDDYAGLDVKDWTPAEVIDDYIDVTGVPEADPDPGWHEVVVKVTAREGEGEPFRDSDLLLAVQAALQEVHPVDGGAPVVPGVLKVAPGR